MYIRAIDDYGGRLEVGMIYEVADYRPRPTPELFVKWKGSRDQFAPLVSFIDNTHHLGHREAFIWRFELANSPNYSPDQCGDTDDDI